MRPALRGTFNLAEVTQIPSGRTQMGAPFPLTDAGRAELCSWVGRWIWTPPQMWLFSHPREQRWRLFFLITDNGPSELYSRNKTCEFRQHTYKVSLPPKFFWHKCIEIIKIFRLHWRLRSGGQQARDTAAIESSPRHGRWGQVCFSGHALLPVRRGDRKRGYHLNVTKKETLSQAGCALQCTSPNIVLRHDHSADRLISETMLSTQRKH